MLFNRGHLTAQLTPSTTMSDMDSSFDKTNNFINLQQHPLSLKPAKQTRSLCLRIPIPHCSNRKYPKPRCNSASAAPADPSAAAQLGLSIHRVCKPPPDSISRPCRYASVPGGVLRHDRSPLSLVAYKPPISPHLSLIHPTPARKSSPITKWPS